MVSAPGGHGLLSGAELFLALGDGAGEDGDLPIVVGLGLGRQAAQTQRHHGDQKQAYDLFHTIFLLVFCWSGLPGIILSFLSE